MKIRIFFSSGLLGILAAFVGLALGWKISAYNEITYEMPGQVSTFVLGVAGEDSFDETREKVRGSLVYKYLLQKQLTVIIASAGDGYPRIIVADPKNILPWLDTPTLNPGEVQIFQDSYSHTLWLAKESIPYLPPNAKVLGAIPPPVGADYLQYVQIFSKDITLPPGKYIINSQDREVLDEFISILAQSGLQVHGSRTLPIIDMIANDPLIGMTLILFLFGNLANALHWFLLSVSRMPEHIIRRQHGERRFSLVKRELLTQFPWVFFAASLGILFTAALTFAISRAPLTANQWLFMSISWVLCLAVALLTRVVVSTALAYLRLGGKDVD